MEYFLACVCVAAASIGVWFFWKSLKDAEDKARMNAVGRSGPDDAVVEIDDAPTRNPHAVEEFIPDDEKAADIDGPPETSRDSWRGMGPAVIVDVSTTGIDPENSRVSAVSLSLCDFDELSGTDVVPKPVRYAFPQGSMSLSKEGAKEIRDVIGRRVLVGHGVAFDKRMLNAEFKKAGIKTLSKNKTKCTLRGSVRTLRDACGVRKRSMGLERALAVFGIKWSGDGLEERFHDVDMVFHLARFLWRYDSPDQSHVEAIRHRLRELQNAG